MEALADRLAELFAHQQGFKSVTFLMDDTAGDYGSFSLWETRADAEAASAAVNPHVTEIFSGMLTPWIFEVYEPHPGAQGPPGPEPS
jgi:hypothetical protein